MTDVSKKTAEKQPVPLSLSAIIIRFLLLVLLVGGVASAFLLLSRGKEIIARQSPQSDLNPAIYYDFEPPFVVNYQWQGDQRYVQIGMSVMTRNPTTAEVIDRNMSLVRNNLILILGSQDFSLMRSDEGKETLKRLILAELQRVLATEMDEPDIEQVLFTRFVVQ